jgi:hypothetical protein
MNIVNNLKIPEFKNHKLTPRNPACLPIDTSRLWVEILWWFNNAQSEINESELSSNVLIDGKYSLVIRYNREKNWKFYPVCILSFDENKWWDICINQFQWLTNKVAFRFYSSFDNISYFISLIEESFSKKHIFISVKDNPDWLECASNWTNAYYNYSRLRNWINALNKKYWLKSNI